jgi:iron complex transport system ATP-binding protein
VARLAAAGHELSLGVVPEGDVAAVAAADAGATVVTVPAFAGVDAASRAAARDLAAAADATVVVADADPTADGSTPDDPAGAAADAVDAAAHVIRVRGDTDGEDLLAAVADPSST